MVNYELYRRYINDLRSYGHKNGLDDTEINEIFEKCFIHLHNINNKNNHACNKHKNILVKFYLFFKLIKIFFITIFCILLGVMVIYNHPATHNLFLRNMQNFIYPGFNIVRKIAVPVISRFPRLTEFYDESCLVENPFFYIHDMDCWPCNAIQSIPDMTGINITKNFNTGTPFTRMENDTKADFNSIIRIFNNNNYNNENESNKDIFMADAPRVTSNSPKYSTIEDVITKRLDKYPAQLQDTHISWRINRMNPGRILRELFPKPIGTPNWWSQSVERFIFIDESNAFTYNLPSPECTNVILRSISGQRLIKMIPSLECQFKCKSNAVILSAGHTLWYNWWYWRPISMPIVNSTELSVQYLTSFC